MITVTVFTEGERFATMTPKGEVTVWIVEDGQPVPMFPEEKTGGV